MRALHALPHGSEVTLSYFPLHWELRERQAQAQQVGGKGRGWAGLGWSNGVQLYSAARVVQQWAYICSFCMHPVTRAAVRLPADGASVAAAAS